MPTIEKSTLAKPSDGKGPRYVFPKTTADLVYVDDEMDETVADRLNAIAEEMENMTYEPIAISSFIANPSYVENGGIITSIKFDFSFNRMPSSISLKIADKTYTVDKSAETYTVSGLSIKGTVNVELTIYDKRGYATKTLAIQKRYRYFYGAAASFGKLTDLKYNLAASRAMTIGVQANAGQNIFFCMPINNVNDVPTFEVGGFQGGFTLLGYTYLKSTSNNASVPSVSNDGSIVSATAGNIKNNESANGSVINATQTYAVYKSDNTGLGSTQIKIS